MPSDFEDWSAARTLRATDATERQVARLWERTVWSDGCLLWTGYVNHGGYGVMGIGHKPFRSVLTHRLSYAVTHGALPDRAYVLHSCDTPACIRPAHLDIGTHAENQRQKFDRGRQAVLAGEDNPRARLNPEVVAEMRRTYRTLRKVEKRGYRMTMAAQYGVTDSAIRAALYGESWYLTEGREAVLKGLGL